LTAQLRRRRAPRSAAGGLWWAAPATAPAYGARPPLSPHRSGLRGNGPGLPVHHQADESRDETRLSLPPAAGDL